MRTNGNIYTQNMNGDKKEKSPVTIAAQGIFCIFVDKSALAELRSASCGFETVLLTLDVLYPFICSGLRYCDIKLTAILTAIGLLFECRIRQLGEIFRAIVFQMTVYFHRHA